MADTKLISKDKMLALVQGQLEAYNNKDLEKFCSYYHNSVTVTRLNTNTTTTGFEGFRKTYQDLFANSPDLKCNLKSRIVLNESVIDEEFVQGLARAPEGLHVCAIYGFKDGLIDRVWFSY